MKRMVLWCAALAVAALPALAAADAAAPRTIDIAAKKFQFTPSEVRLKAGETVVLRLTSEDTTHGFLSKALGFDEDVPPGAPVAITVTPKKAGTYPVICDHYCGKGHGNMRLSIVVEP